LLGFECHHFGCTSNGQTNVLLLGTLDAAAADIEVGCGHTSTWQDPNQTGSVTKPQLPLIFAGSNKSFVTPHKIDTQN
jgi:hypothetical protein